ncbi:hypothetical protein [Hymenobacter metallicola]|uniref:Uncharacterized protein n=1 Tax=Hymenobacter metallicola TaxID=2563114 RepID=A0A4Z0QHD8_9BACT|nr:hypothetical protein [Hymenobacter metallicola]TGE28886.1 hypothetical protein E5K02_05335 [Hymenobacter metallicola]
MLPDFPDSDPADEALRRLWQAAPAPEALVPAAEQRRQLASRRRNILLRKFFTLLCLLAAPLAMLWVWLTSPVGALGAAGLLLTGGALLGAIWRQQRTLRLFYTFPARETPPAYGARLRRYYQWQQRYGLPFYQAYVILLNTGLALFFMDIYRGRPAWQLVLPTGLALLTVVMIRRFSHHHVQREQHQLEQLLRGLDGLA